jgi:hypothetical protein
MLKDFLDKLPEKKLPDVCAPRVAGFVATALLSLRAEALGSCPQTLNLIVRVNTLASFFIVSRVINISC